MKETNNQEKALRIIEALSSVDEELLERSEAVHEYPFNRSIHISRFVGKYSRTLAAACCFLAVGVMFYAVGKVNSSSGKNDSAILTEMIQEEVKEAAAEAAAVEDATVEDATVEDATVEDAVVQEETISANINGEERTESQARAIDTIGKYVPDSLPNGYAFQTASYDSVQNSLLISWTKDMDYIEFFIELVCPEDVTVTDVAEAETNSNPIFSSSDLSEELIEKRMERVEDADDSSVPRGTFGVYYEEESVLVHVTGRGTASDIMALFASMEQ